MCSYLLIAVKLPVLTVLELNCTTVQKCSYFTTVVLIRGQGILYSPYYRYAKYATSIATVHISTIYV